MEPAVDDMRAAIAAAGIGTPHPPMVANDRGAAIDDPAEIRDELAHQLTHPVRWVQCVQFMASRGVTKFIEIGHGRVLGGLIKRIVPDATIVSIGDDTSVRA
jgi:[acyl-carrier-protein] S-malonyltransferase